MYKSIQEAKKDGWIMIPCAFPTHNIWYSRDGVWKTLQELVK